jgi:hypothetical protein
MTTLFKTRNDFIFNLESVEWVEKQETKEGGLFIVVCFKSGNKRNFYGNHAQTVWDAIESSSLTLGY